MPKQSQRVELNSFVKGLITEASPINCPPNATLDEENFELHADGTRSRRLGMDYEVGAIPNVISLPSIDNIGFSTFRWMAAGGDVDRNFLVQQINNTLYFYRLEGSTITGGGYAGSLTLTNIYGNTNWSITSVEGRMVIASDSHNIAIVSYTPPSTFTFELAPIMVRDLWGVEDLPSVETDPMSRPTERSDFHIYNLYNQSWGIPRKNKDGDMSDPVYVYTTAIGKFPSNSEEVWGGLSFKAPATATEQPTERIYPELFDSVRGASGTAAKGYFIINLLRRGSTRALTTFSNNLRYPELAYRLVEIDLAPPYGYRTNLKEDYTTGGASVVEEFSGHVFFSGFRGDVNYGDKRSPILSNYVVFSQLVKNVNDITKCYQAGDPTSRDGSDVVDTDGGWVRISGARKIVAMRNVGSRLVIFASNGVWTLDGGDSSGFSAVNYRVSKISSYGCISAKSVVSEGNRVYFASDSGIYVVGSNQIGEFQVESITLETIQSLYDAIPIATKRNIVGIYDMNGKKIRWLYNDGTDFTLSSQTYEIVFDLRLGAFYKHRIYNATDYSIKVVSPFLDSKNNLKYVTIRKGTSTISLVVSEYRNTKFIDWGTTTKGTDAKAYMITGAITGGDSAIFKQVPYLLMHFERTEKTTDVDAVPNEQSSCMVRTQWDWANKASANKWSPTFQAYRYNRAMYAVPSDSYDNGFELVTTKNKLRGRGRAFSMYMETEPAKDCRIIGWNISINGNALA